MQYTLTFPTGTVQYLFQESFERLQSLYPSQNCIVITDSNIAALYPSLLQPYKTIVLKAGEDAKSWQMIEHIAEELITLEAHRKTLLIGIGGGVVTDITGFVASVYMRGIPFGFVPTTLLGMADASIGGKNGVNLGLHKNILGTVNQPEFILFDTAFLKTLSDEEWSNGFAEIIKYGCLFEPALFEALSNHDIHFYQQHGQALESLIAQCAGWKNKIVLADEKESNIRKLLNFGHTAGHALENSYHLPHGHAVGLGMVIACIISEKVYGLDKGVKSRLIALLEKYNLPTSIKFDIEKVMPLLKMDKKRNTDTIDYIYDALVTFAHASDH
jgi:3-dehydroquinate synthase